MTNGSPGSVVDGVEIGGRDLIAPRVMDPDGSDKADKSDDLPLISNPCSIWSMVCETQKCVHLL